MWHIIEAAGNSLFLVLDCSLVYSVYGISVRGKGVVHARERQSWQWPSLEIENLIRMYVIS